MKLKFLTPAGKQTPTLQPIVSKYTEQFVVVNITSRMLAMEATNSVILCVLTAVIVCDSINISSSSSSSSSSSGSSGSSSYSKRTDRETDMTKLIVTFHNFLNAPKKQDIEA
jgi:hypothetical protein